MLPSVKWPISTSSKHECLDISNLTRFWVGARPCHVSDTLAPTIRNERYAFNVEKGIAEARDCKITVYEFVACFQRIVDRSEKNKMDSMGLLALV